MNFASDNTGPVHPKVMDALMRANGGHAAPYGADDIFSKVESQIREVFESPDAAVFLVATGTAANSLSLSSLVRPWQAIYCSACAHIHTDECGAPEFYSGGAKLVLVPETHGRMEAGNLQVTINEGRDRGLHYVQPGAVSLTQVTECGTVYDLDHIASLTAVARESALPVHMDGARFANALVSLGCTPSEMTWRRGIDAVSFGGTKNGLMAVESVIFFDPDRAEEFIYRRKRGAQLYSKHRYLAAQMAAYFDEDLWIEMATAANARMAQVSAGLSVLAHAEFTHPVEANMAFVALPRGAHRRAVEAGASYYLTLDALEGGSDDDMIPVRLVTNWSTTEEEVERFLSLVG